MRGMTLVVSTSVMFWSLVFLLADRFETQGLPERLDRYVLYRIFFDGISGDVSGR